MIKVFAKNFKNESTFSFYEDDVNHILKVLRKTIDDELICIFDNTKYLAKIISLKPLIAQKIKVLENNHNSNSKLDIFQAMIKPKNMELITQKLTELNVDEFYPVMFERSQKQNFLDSKNINRLQTIIKNASMQSGRFKYMEMNESISFLNMLNKLDGYDLIIVPYENEQANYIHISDLNNCLKIAIIIGPEGGFSLKEIEQLKQIDKVKLIKLTDTILKSETACIYCVSVVSNYLLMRKE